MIVVDASVFVSALTNVDGRGDWAGDQVRNPDILSTESMPAEVHNALRRLDLAGEITSSDAMRAREEFFEFSIELFSFARYADRVWTLRRNLTCYDAWYVALAEALDCPLVTIDYRLSRAVGPECAFVTPPDA
ncbi:MAG: type II toxin-antitoxin system VapC family toxin [Chloroflexi bacterium]|nr:type II toxin-antitoxin system VapC family toxin [Chloroflexota bacterium]